MPRKFWMKIDTLAELVEDEPPVESLLSIRRTAPLSSDTFAIVTFRFIAVGLAWTIAAMLRLIMMFPSAMTFTNATLVQVVFIVSFATGSVALITVHGMTAITACTTTRMIITATCVFICMVTAFNTLSSYSILSVNDEEVRIRGSHASSELSLRISGPGCLTPSEPFFSRDVFFPHFLRALSSTTIDEKQVEEAILFFEA